MNGQDVADGDGVGVHDEKLRVGMSLGQGRCKKMKLEDKASEDLDSETQEVEASEDMHNCESELLEGQNGKAVLNEKSEEDLGDGEIRGFEKKEEGEECDSEEKEVHEGEIDVKEDDVNVKQYKRRVKIKMDSLNEDAIVSEIGQPSEEIDGEEDGVRRGKRPRKPAGAYAEETEPPREKRVPKVPREKRVPKEPKEPKEKKVHIKTWIKDGDKKKRVTIIDGEVKESNMCHQCQRNDRRGEVVRCKVCPNKRFCQPCITKWYPDASLESIAEACPVCTGICNCKNCLRLYLKSVETSQRKLEPEEKVEYSKYLLKYLLPVLRQINQEQVTEKEVEATIQGMQRAGPPQRPAVRAENSPAAVRAEDENAARPDS